jgi:hypothetical protein
MSRFFFWRVDIIVEWGGGGEERRWRFDDGGIQREYHSLCISCVRKGSVLCFVEGFLAGFGVSGVLVGVLVSVVRW